MGLDVRCRCGDIDFEAGSYNGFGLFRQAIAKAFGIDLYEMARFLGTKPWTTEEPFYELLTHSDCDGELSSEQCEELLTDFEQHSEKIIGVVSEGMTLRKKNLVTGEVREVTMDSACFKENMRLWKEAVQHAVDEDCTLEFC